MNKKSYFIVLKECAIIVLILAIIMKVVSRLIPKMSLKYGHMFKIIYHKILAH